MFYVPKTSRNDDAPTAGTQAPDSRLTRGNLIEVLDGDASRWLELCPSWLNNLFEHRAIALIATSYMEFRCKSVGSAEGFLRTEF
jgi:hypothetical protein